MYLHEETYSVKLFKKKKTLEETTWMNNNKLFVSFHAHIIRK